MFDKLNEKMAKFYSEKATLKVFENGDRIIDFDVLQRERLKYEFILPALIPLGFIGVCHLIGKVREKL